jgi:hypothetical protein
VLKAIYILTTTAGEWLPAFLFGVAVTGLLAWALWLNFFWRR